MAVFLVADAAPGLAGTLQLRWMQPAGSAPVTSFRVYQGSVVGAGAVVFDGLPTRRKGIYSVTLASPETTAGATLYVWVTAVNRGEESRPSRPLVLGRPQPPIGAPGLPHFVLE